jgi:hypothetical protein
MNTLKFEQSLPEWRGLERKAIFVSCYFDLNVDPAIVMNYDLYYRNTGDTEWLEELKNSQTSTHINPISGEFNFRAGLPLSLITKNSTIVNEITGDVIIGEVPAGVATIGEFDFYQDLLTNLAKLSELLGMIFKSDSAHGLQHLAMLGLMKAISANRIN